MDGQSFDRIARALGSGQSRRTVAKGLAAGLLGLIGGSRMIEPAGATILCSGSGESCAEVSCCEDHQCVDTGEGSFCEPTCSWRGEDCNEQFGCCAGFVCSSEGYCALEVTTCGIQWDPCDYYEGDVLVECCDGFTCEDSGEGSYCQYYCTVEGGSCSQVIPTQEGGVVCCDGLVCNDEEMCVIPPPTCAAEGESCAELGCCGDLACLESGVCGVPPVDPGPDPKPEPKPTTPPVVKLPDTGAGESSTGSEWLIPTALGAAAAAVAAQRLRDGRKDTSGETI